jgi:hypothetical protein
MKIRSAVVIAAVLLASQQAYGQAQNSVTVRAVDGSNVPLLTRGTGFFILKPGTGASFSATGNTLTVNASGTGTNPGGTDTAVQFNNAGAFGGDATNFNYNSGTHALTVTGPLAAGATTLGGNLIFGTDATFNIGANGANRPAAIFTSGQINAGTNIVTGSTNGLQFGSRSVMKSNADGNINVTNTAGTGFGMFQFGPATASFPALRVNGTILETKLGDNTAYTQHGASSFLTVTNTVTFSATPVFNLTLGGYQLITLTGNVTSSTLSNLGAGMRITFKICQDGTGNRTFVPPANLKGFTTIGSTLSTCTVQEFMSTDSSNLYAIAAGQTNQ